MPPPPLPSATRHPHLTACRVAATSPHLTSPIRTNFWLRFLDSCAKSLARCASTSQLPCISPRFHAPVSLFTSYLKLEHVLIHVSLFTSYLPPHVSLFTSLHSRIHTSYLPPFPHTHLPCPPFPHPTGHAASCLAYLCLCLDRTCSIYSRLLSRLPLSLPRLHAFLKLRLKLP